MFISAATVQQVHQLILSDCFYQDIIKKFISNRAERNEFTQELWIYICEMQSDKILNAWNNRTFKYLYVSIVKNQVASKTSKWHRKFRNLQLDGHNVKFLESVDEMDECSNEENPEFNYIQNELKEEKEMKLRIVDSSIEKINKDPQMYVKTELFKMYFMENKSYREIAKQTKIPLVTVYAYVQEAEKKIKQHINKHYYNQ